jgi:glucan phosphoethanolaminetransferase (alkaline phosphatase superfamily)
MSRTKGAITALLFLDLWVFTLIILNVLYVSIKTVVIFSVVVALFFGFVCVVITQGAVLSVFEKSQKHSHRNILGSLLRRSNITDGLLYKRR